MALINAFDRNFNLGELNSPEFTGNPVPITPAARKQIARANLGMTDGQSNIGTIPTPTGALAMTAAQTLGGAIIGAPTAAVNYTLPTGAQMDAYFVPPTVDKAYAANFLTNFGQTSTLTIVDTNVTAGNAITLVANTGFSIQGSAAIPGGPTSGTFLLVRAAAATWIAIRE
jgi:hypothetical protein